MYYILLYLLSVTGTEAIISSPQSIILTIFIAVLSDYKEDLQIRLPQNSPQWKPELLTWYEFLCQLGKELSPKTDHADLLILNV